jgi:hypothetical protein
MSSKSKHREISQKDSGIAQMITWFDGYSTLHLVDPLRIERLLKSRSGSDLDLVWKNVKKDISAIVELPASSEQVKKFSRLASYARLASMILAGVSFVILILIYFFQSRLKLQGDQIIAPALVIAFLYVMIMVSLFASRRMNSAVRSYYQEHSHELSKSTARLKEAAQTLIDRLQRDVTSHNLDPMQYKFKIFQTDYRNITVLRGNGLRHSAIVKVKTPRKE